MRLPIYLDYNATTPIEPAVLQEMQPYLTEVFGNPSSAHRYGYEAKNALDWARTRVAGLLGCAPDEVVFTGGGSEGNNLAIKGVAFAHMHQGRHLITSQIEHPAVLNTCRYLEQRHGFTVTYLPVDATGRVSLADMASSIRSDTILITLMAANNETGTLQPIAEIGSIARSRGVLFHTDAAQAVGKIPLNMDALAVDLLTVVGHKLYAPKGVGALYVRKGVQLDSLIHGASHEGGRRAGTENVPYAVALGKACAIAQGQMDEELPRLAALRDRLLSALEKGVPSLRRNGHATATLPGTLNVAFPGVPGYELLSEAREVAASTGSACHAGRPEPSPMLLAMGVPADVAVGAVRLSVGRWTTAEEVDMAAEMLITAFRRIIT